MSDIPEVEIITSAAHLTIANLHLEISCPDLPLMQERDAVYQQFTTPERSHTLNIPVHVQPESIMPLLNPLTKIFETERAWAMYSDSQNRYIAQHHRDRTREPRWLVKIPPDSKEFNVYCSKDAVLQYKEQDVLMNPVRYPLDQLLLINSTVGKAMLIHAAGVIINGKGYIFAGQSGAGKSTLCRYISEYRELTVLSDDRIVIWQDEQGFSMHGTPWPGEAEIAVNDCARLHGIFFLNHSGVNNISDLNPGEAMKYLVNVGSLPWYDEKDLQKSLDLCGNLMTGNKTYEMRFRPGHEIIEDLIAFVSG